jgi:hypothetical protein
VLLQGVSFAVVNHLEPTGESGAGAPAAAKPAPYALRIKAAEALQRFVGVVEQHKKGGAPA